MTDLLLFSLMNRFMKEGLVLFEMTYQDLPLEFLMVLNQVNPLLKSDAESLHKIVSSNQQKTSAPEDHIACSNDPVTSEPHNEARFLVDWVADVDGACIDEVEFMHLIDFFNNEFLWNKSSGFKNVHEADHEQLQIGVLVGEEGIP